MATYQIMSIQNIKVLFVAQPCKDMQRSKSQNTSIFQDSQINGIIQGPRYDKRGEIIKRSIVGTVDQFQREGKVQQDSRVTDDDSSMLRSFVITSFTKKKNLKKKREPVQLSKISKEDIQLHIDKIQKSIKLSEISLRSKEESLPIIERNLLTRQRRILESCEEQKEKWTQLEQELANRCERSYSNTLLNKSQGYREKRQLLDTLNAVQREPNVKEWYGNLRKYEQTNDPTIEIIKSGNNVKICSDKFKNMINQRLSKQYYDSDYIIVNGNSKLTLESKEARDLMILPQDLVQQPTKDFNYSNYNKRDISRRSSYRIVQLQ
ncbi:unnamed protein product [Paramecium octaurelia]|uniref:Uncharacterized protein n=1 Tax=Paramecium octaurelia TaxID=43137 RepID=A0A8S1XYP0_PAROT|nr:unnamed protein product [Paramecium octaurelia]